jgi:RNA-directed DNA polymerase
MRPLGIPCMFDRAQQALYQLALDPVAETMLDPNSYGFRRERATADAVGQCFVCLAKTCSPEWILEGDIHACFDEISHEWMLKHVLMDTAMLRKWLTAGYIEQDILHPTDQGTPQGGIISPVLANLTLNGLERILREKYPSRTRKGKRAKVNLIRYADDFIITGSSKELLEQEVKPLVTQFLKERGLSLSEEKTVITHIDDGFDFLGQNVRKYKGKLIIMPSKKNYAAVIEKIRDTVRRAKAMTPAQLIGQLNPIIRGWANYHRHVCSKRMFEKADKDIFHCVWRWAKRKHPRKSNEWVAQKYFMPPSGRKWTLNVTVEEQEGMMRTHQLFRASSVPIRRHVKIKGEANPYDPHWEPYFEARARAQARSNPGWRYDEYLLWQQQGGKCPMCQQDLTEERGWDIHHKIWKVYGGTDDLNNLELLHPNCHRQIHSRAAAAFRDGTGSGDTGSGEARAVCDESRTYGS